MVLVKVSGVITKKALISGNIRMRQLQKQLVPEELYKHSLFMMIKHDKVSRKICAPDKILKDMHERYSDKEGYLNIMIVK